MKIQVDGHEFLLDLPPAVCRHMRCLLEREACKALQGQPWGLRAHTFGIVLPPRPGLVGMVPADEPMTFRTAKFTVLGPSEITRHHWLIEPAERRDREVLAHLARELLNTELREVEAWER